MSMETGAMDKDQLVSIKHIVGMTQSEAHKAIQHAGLTGVVVEIDEETVDVKIEGKGKILMKVSDGKVVSYKIS